MKKNRNELDENKATPVLSICISTFNRAKFIVETLDSIICQIPPNVELIIVDGASQDNTFDVMHEYVLRHPEVNYYREIINSGIDADYDRAVGYAKGQYCWLMTDDDLLKPGAVQKVLAKLDGVNELVIVNAEVKTVDLLKVLQDKYINFNSDKVYRTGDAEKLFIDMAMGLTFIGCVVIKRDVWNSRDRKSYYGTLFVHVGVIFQGSPIANGTFIQEPLITIRYGNAMWAPRGLEIWIIKWPKLIWSFKDFKHSSLSLVCPPGDLYVLRKLMFYRGTGAFTLNEYNKILSKELCHLARFVAKLILITPQSLVGFILCLRYLIFDQIGSKMAIYSFNMSPNKSLITGWFAKKADVL